MKPKMALKKNEMTVSPVKSAIFRSPVSMGEEPGVGPGCADRKKLNEELELAK